MLWANKMMRNKNSLRRLLSIAGMWLVFLFLLPSALYAQNWTMPVDGKVFSNNDKLTGSVVTLYKNGTQIQQVVTTSNGKFSFELTPNAEYVIAITKPGFVTNWIRTMIF